MSLFKKKDEDVKKAYKPTGDAKEKAGASGKGGGEPAKPTYDPKSKGFADIIEKRNNDGNFGYGYVDENTGIEVPWYIDMINGGGANAAGPEFVSPFAELPFEGGMLSAPSKIGNAMNIAPYGYNQPRKYAQAGMVGYPELPAAPAPVGNGATTTPDPINVPQDFSNLSDAPSVRRSLIGYNPQVVAGSAPAPTTAGPIMAGHNLPPIQGAGPTEQQLRERAIQTYGQLFLDMSETGQRAIMRGIAQGMANAN